MNMKIISSLILAITLYAGAAVAMLAPTAQQFGGAASRSATALGASAARYGRLSQRAYPGTAARSYMTQQPAEQHYGIPHSTGYTGLSGAQRSPFLRSQLGQPIGSRSFSTDDQTFTKPWKTGAEPWQILEIPKTASYADAQKAYRVIIQKVHPDKNPNNLTAATQATQEANNALAWFKGDRRTSQKTQEYTSEQSHQDRESYEYYKQRTSGGHSYGHYQQRASGHSYGHYQQRVSSALAALLALGWFIRQKAADRNSQLSFENNLQDLKSIIDQINELHTEFETHKFPKFLVEQFTLELEDIKKEIVSKLSETKNRQKAIDLLNEYTLLLNNVLENQQRLLKRYSKDPYWINRIVDAYEKAYFGHKKIFENSPRRSSLPDNTYTLPKSSPVYEWSLAEMGQRLESEIAKEKAQQALERKSVDNTQESYLKRIKNLWSYYTGHSSPTPK